jgi:signal transduction histidine kinase
MIHHGEYKREFDEGKEEGDGDGDDYKDVVVNIKDTGTGIDPEICPKLFTKFATKSEIGTGLGLFICKSTNKDHREKLWAKNNKADKGLHLHLASQSSAGLDRKVGTSGK